MSGQKDSADPMSPNTFAMSVVGTVLVRKDRISGADIVPNKEIADPEIIRDYLLCLL